MSEYEKIAEGILKEIEVYQAGESEGMVIVDEGGLVFKIRGVQ